MPDPDGARSLRHGATDAHHELDGIAADLEDVVQQGEERRQREGRHEDGHEAELNHWKSEVRVPGNISIPESILRKRTCYSLKRSSVTVFKNRQGKSRTHLEVFQKQRPRAKII